MANCPVCMWRAPLPRVAVGLDEQLMDPGPRHRHDSPPYLPFNRGGDPLCESPLLEARCCQGAAAICPSRAQPMLPHHPPSRPPACSSRDRDPCPVPCSLAVSLPCSLLVSGIPSILYVCVRAHGCSSAVGHLCYPCHLCHLCHLCYLCHLCHLCYPCHLCHLWNLCYLCHLCCLLRVRRLRPLLLSPVSAL